MRKLGLVIVALALAGFMAAPAWADHQPAGKVGVAASVLEVLKACVKNGGNTCPGSSTVLLLKTTIKAPDPDDLILAVTLECALFTDIKVQKNAESEAIATVTVFIEIDGTDTSGSGTVVPVTGDSDGNGTFDDPDDGKVVFCNRAFKLKISGFVDEDPLFELFLRTRNANAFNWVAASPISGQASNVHTVRVFAKLEVNVTGNGEARAIVGKRTLVIEPTKLINDAQF